jgi:hypothetical protein
LSQVPGSLDKKDATFYLIKDGTFFPLLCLTNPALYSSPSEATALEYPRLSVWQDILFRYNYSMGNWGLIVQCTKRCENKSFYYLRNIKTGSNCFFNASYTIHPDISSASCSGRVCLAKHCVVCTLKMSPQFTQY